MQGAASWEAENNMALDALVVGAGPVGLVMAFELRRHGLSCRIIDKADSPSIWSKAQVVHARTLECFQDMGIVDEVLARGRSVSGSRIMTPELQAIARVELGGIDSPYPYFLSLSQRETELLLAQNLEKTFGVHIERNVTLDGFTQDTNGVHAKLVHLDGSTEELSVPWILGCDGAHSNVRKTLGLPFEGSTYEGRIVQADVRVIFPHAVHDDEIAIFLGSHGMLAFFPLPGEHRYRMLTFVDPGDERPVELETFKALLAERGPKGSELSDPAWMVDFRINCRLVARYRVGRAFLSGDAAHIHSPAGGQGMNMGIQDAYNLAWKLALVQRGQAKEAILDSYEMERRPIAEAVLRATDASTKGFATVVSLKNPIAIGIRNHLMNFVTSLDVVKSKTSRSMSQIEIGYPKSPIVGQDQVSLWSVGMGGSAEHPGLSDWVHFGDGPAPGTRVPDMPVGDKTLFDVLRGPQHTLFCFDGAAATEEGYHRLAQIITHAKNRLGESIKAFVVVPTPTRPERLAADVSVLFDTEGEMHRRFGARSECLYLVRPDGYVAYRCQPADEHRLSAYLDRVFV
jgi:2-polyprenyl-6-methoxyphenol hydroxylase-like FAD-dependent oxidoreductase